MDEIVDSGVVSRRTAGDNAALLDLNNLLHGVKAALIDLSSKADAEAKYDSMFPVEAATAFSNRPMSSQMAEYARAVVDAMHRSSPDDVEQWSEMPRSEQRLMISGIKGLLDAGHCIVPEEVVMFARGAGRRIRELESKIQELERPRR